MARPKVTVDTPMGRRPQVSLVAYKERRGDFIFVSVPSEIARYVRTHKCVAYVHCPNCKAMVGEPCKSRYRYVSDAHYTRKRLFSQRWGGTYALAPDDVTNG